MLTFPDVETVLLLIQAKLHLPFCRYITVSIPIQIVFYYYSKILFISIISKLGVLFSIPVQSNLIMLAGRKITIYWKDEA